MVGDASGGNGTQPAASFVCHACSTCVATSENLLETRDDIVAFRELHGSPVVDKVNKTVVCPGCEQAIGSRTDSSYMLRRDRVLKRSNKLEIMICSLKSQEIQDLTAFVSEAFPHSNITPRVLQKSELRGFQLSPAARPGPDLVVVVHRSEGRILLTDRNGFYHDVIGSAWQLTRGNVLVVLTRNDPKAETGLYDEKLLLNLSTQGDQPTIGAISALGRVLTWETKPSGPQLAQLKTMTSKAYYKEAPAPAQGIPGTWNVSARASAKAAANPNWCMLL